MDTIFSVFIGLAIGYIVGTRDGREGYAKLRDSITTIMASDEVKAMRSSGPGLLGAMVKQGISLISGPISKD